MAEGAIGALAVRIVGDVSDFVQKFDRADKAVEKFSNKLDRRLLQPLAKVGAAAAVAGAGILALTTRATKMGDQFAKMSEKVGASTEFLSAFSHAASLGGVSTEQLEKGLGRMTRTMSDASNGLATAQRSFGQLGVEVKNTDGSLREVPDVILEVADRFASMTDATKKAALAQEIFGRSGLDLIPVLNQGSEAIRKQMEEAKRLGIVWSTEAAKAAEEFNDNLERLGKAVDGLNIKLAGPMVEAFNKAAEAMLNAQGRGEGFFRTIIEGFRTMVTGDDVHKWNVEMAEAGDALIKAQNKMEQAMRVQRAPGMKEWGTRLVKEAKTAVDRAQAEIKRLQDIKPILAPDAKPKDAGGRAVAPAMQNDAQVKAREALATKLLEIDRRMREAAATEAQIQYGQWLEGEAMADETAEALRSQRLKALQAHLGAERQLRQEAVADEIVIAREAAEHKWQLEREAHQKQLKARRDFVVNMTGLMNTSSKKTFQIGKIAALSEAAVKGTLATIEAFEQGMKIGGPWTAAAFAAASTAATANMINNIRSQHFGGGGGAPIAPSQGSSGISPVGAGGGATSQQQRGPDTILNIRGDDIFTGRTVARLAERLNEFTRDGGRVMVSQS